MRRSAHWPLVLVALVSVACAEAPPDEASASDGTSPSAATGEARIHRSGQPAMRVDSHRAVMGNVPARISASGSIRARRFTPLAAEVPGRLVEVFVEVGETVEEGEVLFRIDPVPYELALSEARAGLALAEAENDNAAHEAARVGELVRENAVSEQHHDRLRTQAAVAGARVAQMQVRVDRAERELERTQVVAPYAGSIVERMAHEGAMAGADPVVVLQESGALEAVLDIPEAAPVAVRPGARVLLFTEGRAQPIEARVARVSDRIDDGTRTYQVHCPMEVESGGAKAGSYVRAEVLPDSGEPRPVVDRSALVVRDGRTFVFRVKADRVEQVTVVVGVVGSDRAEILGGIEAGDMVVRGEAAGRIADGDRVETTGELTTAAAASEPAS